MKEIKEKQLANEIDFLLWNDKIDILAVVNKNSEISLYRLSWKKIWSYYLQKNSDAQVTAMIWRPDGKAIVVAYSTGEIFLIGLEKKKSINLKRPDESNPITFISWFEKKYDTLCDDNEESNLENEEIDLVYDSSFMKFEDNDLLRYEPTEYDDSHLFKTNNILIMATDNGVLNIAIHSTLLFRIYVIKEKFQCSKILQINISVEFDRIYVLIRDLNNETYMVILRTDFFRDKEKELKSLSIKHYNIVKLTRLIDRSMDVLNESWNKILFEMDIKLSKYANKYSSEQLVADFFNLLVFGFLSNEMQEFLTGDLTEKEFKKLGTTIESSYSKIQNVLSKNLTDATMQLIYVLSELCGLSELTYYKEHFGLQYDVIREAMKTTASFFLKSKEVEQVIIQSMINFKSFFRWVYVVMLRLLSESVPQDVVMMTTQDVNHITEFLKNFLKSGQKNKENNESHFNFERIAQYLEDKPLTVPCDFIDNEWLPILKNTELLNTGLVYTNNQKASLKQSYRRINKDINDIFLQIEQQFQHLILIDTYIAFKNSSKYSSIYLEADNLLFHACVKDNELPIGVLLNYIQIKNDNVEIFGLNLLFSESANNLQIVDLQFYDQKILMILLVDYNQRVSYLCQYSFFTDPLIYKNIGFKDTLHTEAYPQIYVDFNDCNGMQFIRVQNFVAKSLSTSGNRKLCVLLGDNLKSIKIYEMNTDEDEDEDNDDDADISMNSLRNSSYSGKNEDFDFEE